MKRKDSDRILLTIKEVKGGALREKGEDTVKEGERSRGGYQITV